LSFLQVFHPPIDQTIPEAGRRDHKRTAEAITAGDESRLSQAVRESFEGWKQNPAMD
jgi:hypothetical protein